MKSRVILACVFAASEAGALIRPPMAAASAQAATTLGISPGYYQEVCHTLKLGDKRRYSFTSNLPLEFNIHYHLEEAVIHLAVGHDVQSKEGLMVAGADREETYCWMWMNLQMQSAELTFWIWEETP